MAAWVTRVCHYLRCQERDCAWSPTSRLEVASWRSWIRLSSLLQNNKDFRIDAQSCKNFFANSGSFWSCKFKRIAATNLFSATFWVTHTVDAKATDFEEDLARTLRSKTIHHTPLWRAEPWRTSSSFSDAAGSKSPEATGWFSALREFLDEG